MSFSLFADIISGFFRKNPGVRFNFNSGNADAVKDWPESKFDKMKFVPLAPRLEFGSVLVWKKNQIQSAAVEAFIDFSKKYIKGISVDTI